MLFLFYFWYVLLLDISTKNDIMRDMRKNKNNRDVMDALVMVFQYGINMLVPIFICTMLGVWIGNKTGVTWIAVPLFFVGALAGFNNVYRMAKRLIDSDNKGKKNVKKNQ